MIYHKDLIDSVGGQILSAYCTCAAGLYGSCNHVAGLPFTIKAAALTGLSNPTYKNVSAAWSIPSTKKKIIPDEILKFIFTNEAYVKNATQESEEAKKKEQKLSRILGLHGFFL